MRALRVVLPIQGRLFDLWVSWWITSGVFTPLHCIKRYSPLVVCNTSSYKDFGLRGSQSFEGCTNFRVSFGHWHGKTHCINHLKVFMELLLLHVWFISFNTKLENCVLVLFSALTLARKNNMVNDYNSHIFLCLYFIRYFSNCMWYL